MFSSRVRSLIRLRFLSVLSVGLDLYVVFLERARFEDDPVVTDHFQVIR